MTREMLVFRARKVVDVDVPPNSSYFTGCVVRFAVDMMSGETGVR